MVNENIPSELKLKNRPKYLRAQYLLFDPKSTLIRALRHVNSETTYGIVDHF